MRLSVDAVIGARGAAKGRGMWVHWDAAWDAAGVRHAAALERSMRLRLSVACGCIGAKHAAALGRSVGLRRCAAWGSARCNAELR